MNNNYRVWNKEESCWVDEVFLTPNGEVISVEPHRWKSDIYKTDLKPDNKFIVQHSINITDKNNTEIYEGDIVQTEFDVIGVIVYVPDRLSFILIDFKENKFYILTELRCKQCEIIGNVMENIDLVPDGVPYNGTN